MIVLGKNGESFAKVTKPFRSVKLPLSGEVTADYGGLRRGEAISLLPSSTKSGVVQVMVVRVHETSKGLVRDPKSPVVDGWVAGKASADVEYVYDDLIAASRELNAVLREERLRG